MYESEEATLPLTVDDQELEQLTVLDYIEILDYYEDLFAA